jgi:hypothetical protein
MRRAAVGVVFVLLCATAGPSFAKSVVSRRPSAPAVSPAVAADATAPVPDAATRRKKKPKTCEELATKALDKASKKLLNRLEKVENNKKLSLPAKGLASYDALNVFTDARIAASTGFLDCVTSVTGVAPARAGKHVRERAARTGMTQSVDGCAGAFSASRTAAYGEFSTNLAFGSGKPSSTLVAVAANSVGVLDIAVDAAAASLVDCVFPLPPDAAPANVRSQAVRPRATDVKSCVEQAGQRTIAAYEAEAARAGSIYHSSAATGPRELALAYERTQTDQQVNAASEQLVTCLAPDAASASDTSAGAVQTVPGIPQCPPHCTPPPPTNPTIDHCVATYKAALLFEGQRIVKGATEAAEYRGSGDHTPEQLGFIKIMIGLRYQTEAEENARKAYIQLILCAGDAPDLDA